VFLLLFFYPVSGRFSLSLSESPLLVYLSFFTGTWPGFFGFFSGFSLLCFLLFPPPRLGRFLPSLFQSPVDCISDFILGLCYWGRFLPILFGFNGSNPHSRLLPQLGTSFFCVVFLLGFQNVVQFLFDGVFLPRKFFLPLFLFCFWLPPWLHVFFFLLFIIGF